MQQFVKFRRPVFVVRSLFFVSILALVLIGATARGHASSSYTIIDLGTLGGTISEGMAINAAGQVTGRATVAADGAAHAVLFNGGVRTDLGTLGGSDSVGVAINAAGQIAGNSTIEGNYGPRAFRFSDGALVPLGTFGGLRSSATGINSAGYVVGWADFPGFVYRAFAFNGQSLVDLGTLGGLVSVGMAINASGQATGVAATAANQGHAFLYSGGPLVDLGTFGGGTSIGLAINDAGQVTGTAMIPTGGQHAFLYSGGPLVDLGTLGGIDSQGTAINAAGHVAGWSYMPGDVDFHAFLYSAGITKDLGTLGGSSSTATAINAAGEVTGWAETADGTRHAFVYDGETMTDLNTLVPPGSGWILTTATAINDNGQITGSGQINGETHAFLLTPSQFAATVQQPINPDGSSVFKASRGVVPVKFSLAVDGSPTCQLPPATISVSRLAGGTIGTIDETTYLSAADSGANFRVADCQYIYNLSAPALGPGTYRVDIRINSVAVGSALFSLK